METKAINLLGKELTVYIDRPIGSKHPKFETIYELNYGYIKEFIAGDGDYADAYVLGIDKPVKKFVGKVIAVIKRNNDVEDKLVVSNAYFSSNEIKNMTRFQEQYFDTEIIMHSKRP